MAAAHDHVPGELVEDILSRVPANSLLRFKTASKNWYSLLSQDYIFAKSHLKQSKNHHVVFFKNLGETTFQALNIDTNESSKIPVKDECELIGSANGLICLTLFTGSLEAKICRNASGKGGCFIWNPFTSECKRIPVPIGKARVFGFGYDSYSDDYKIVAYWDEYFRVFSLKTNSWKIFEDSFVMRDYGFYLNGALHWCLNEEMVTFDLANEVFSYMELPHEMKLINSENQLLRRKRVTLLEYQGLLCLSGGTSIWVMKKYGDGKSWVKLSTILVEHKIRLGISRAGEVVYQLKDGFGFVKSDVQGRVSDDVKLRIASGDDQFAFKYTESLISPRCFDKKSEEMIERPRKQRKTQVPECCSIVLT